MHVITKKRIWSALEAFPKCRHSLESWYRVISRTRVECFADLKSIFRTVDKVGSLYVFDIAGNTLRLIASIHFNRQKIYIREILAHTQYDKGHWKNERK